MVVIEPFNGQGAPRLADFWERAGLTHPWNDSLKDIGLAQDHPTNVILLARDGSDEIVGSVMAGFDGHRGWIYSLAVAASQRGQGTGRMLIERAEAWLRQHGAPVARLLVQGSNAQAGGFYEACGYERGDFIAFGKRL
jgi:ribosomal protein S18 acetylase RimI-like enzyme